MNVLPVHLCIYCELATADKVVLVVYFVSLRLSCFHYEYQSTVCRFSVGPLNILSRNDLQELLTLVGLPTVSVLKMVFFSSENLSLTSFPCFSLPSIDLQVHCHVLQEPSVPFGDVSEEVFAPSTKARRY